MHPKNPTQPKQPQLHQRPPKLFCQKPKALLDPRLSPAEVEERNDLTQKKLLLRIRVRRDRNGRGRRKAVSICQR
jgi:hypothetical protein